VEVMYAFLIFIPKVSRRFRISPGCLLNSLQPSVCTHETAVESLNGFSLNLI
jgi:hypothetical protein